MAIVAWQMICWKYECREQSYSVQFCAHQSSQRITEIALCSPSCSSGVLFICLSGFNCSQISTVIYSTLAWFVYTSVSINIFLLLSSHYNELGFSITIFLITHSLMSFSRWCFFPVTWPGLHISALLQGESANSKLVCAIVVLFFWATQTFENNSCLALLDHWVANTKKINIPLELFRERIVNNVSYCFCGMQPFIAQPQTEVPFVVPHHNSKRILKACGERGRTIWGVFLFLFLSNSFVW